MQVVSKVRALGKVHEVLANPRTLFSAADLSVLFGQGACYAIIILHFSVLLRLELGALGWESQFH